MRTKLAALAALVLLAAPALAKPPVYSTDDGAINGYDPVAYFVAGKPVKGDADITFEWNGAVWRFANADNRARFEADPERYAPRFGGYCAYAVSTGYTASTVPEAWRIVDDRLYLNYSLSVRKRWEKDIPGYIEKAEANWPAVLDK